MKKVAQALAIAAMAAIAVAAPASAVQPDSSTQGWDHTAAAPISAAGWDHTI